MMMMMMMMPVPNNEFGVSEASNEGRGTVLG
jgi:hypothetical protein